MDPKEQLAALQREAEVLRSKAASGTMTAEDTDRSIAIAAEYEEVKAVIKRREDASIALRSIAGVSTQDSSDERPDTGASMIGKTLGERFTSSPEFKALKASNPSGLGKGTPVAVTTKNIGPTFIAKVDPAPVQSGVQGNARAVRTNEIDDLVYRPQRRLLEVITRGTTDLPWFQYRQVISKANNAAIVAEAKTTTGTNAAGGLKPLSTLATQTAEAKAFTYADGMEVTNQELTDDGIMQTLINSTLAENLDIHLEHILLNGAGTADEPAGVLNTTGVLQQAFATDMPTSIRKAITLLRNTSGAPIQGVLLNPEDDEAWDLMKDTHGDWIGSGPFAQNLPTAWGFERIATQAIPVGQALVGDFRTIQLLQLEALSVLAFNQHKDYAQRNLVYVRAELRATQLIRNAARLCLVDLTV